MKEYVEDPAVVHDEKFEEDESTELVVPVESTVGGAYVLAEELRKLRFMLNYSYIQAGKVLHKINSTKAYKSLDHKTFLSFLADPEYGMPKSTAYLYLHIYKFYVLEHGQAEDSLTDIDVVRLRDLMAVIRLEPEAIGEWLDKARNLGKVDLINEIRHARGLDTLDIISPAPDENEVVVVRSNYTELCRASECIVCGARPIDFHHFPRTRGAGADDDKVIPLCRGCHIAFHQDPKTLLWENRVKIFGWFYKIIFGLLGIKDSEAKS